MLDVGRTSDVPGAVVRALLRDQLDALELLSARMAAVRQGVTQGRAAADEVKQAEETVEWLRRLTREVLLDLGERTGRSGPEDVPRAPVERAARNAVRRWSRLMPQVELRLRNLDDVWTAMPAVALERVLQGLILQAGRRARSLVTVRFDGEQDGHVLLVVEDDGSRGSDEEEVAPTDEAAEGDGRDEEAGIAVRWLAERWSGELAVGPSERLGGRVVRLRLPHADPPPGRGVDSSAILEGVRVGVVDDEPALLKVVSAILERSGAHVIRVGDGFGDPEALARRLLEMDLDVVLMDVHLGPISGVDVLKAVASQGGDQDRVVLMSGSAEEFREEVQVPVVGKPPEWPILIRRIRAVARP